MALYIGVSDALRLKLVKGAVFTKVHRIQSKQRHIRCDEELTKVLWEDSKSRKPKGEALVSELQSVRGGEGVIRGARGERVLLLQFSSRLLTLESATRAQRDEWLHAFQQLLDCKAAVGGASRASRAREGTPASELQANLVKLLAGVPVKKHRKRRSKDRLVWVTLTFDEVMWGTDVDSPKGSEPLDDLHVVQVGARSPEFAASCDASAALSLIFPDRTLDLELSNAMDSDLLARTFTEIIDFKLHPERKEDFLYWYCSQSMYPLVYSLGDRAKSSRKKRAKTESSMDDEAMVVPRKSSAAFGGVHGGAPAEAVGKRLAEVLSAPSAELALTNYLRTAGSLRMLDFIRESEELRRDYGARCQTLFAKYFDDPREEAAVSVFTNEALRARIKDQMSSSSSFVFYEATNRLKRHIEEVVLPEVAL